MDLKQLQLPMDIPPIRTPLIVALGNRARQGKSSAADAIEKYARANGFTRVLNAGFADGVYSAARQYFGMTGKDGPLLQRVGQGMRDIDPDVWTRYYDTRLAAEKPELALIFDVRYPNEIEYIKSKNGYCVQIQRFTKDGSRLVAQDRDPDHISEKALDNHIWDYVVKAGPLAELEEGARQVFDQIHMAAYGCPVNQTDQATEDSDGG